MAACVMIPAQSLMPAAAACLRRVRAFGGGEGPLSQRAAALSAAAAFPAAGAAA